MKLYLKHVIHTRAVVWSNGNSIYSYN